MPLRRDRHGRGDDVSAPGPWDNVRVLFDPDTSIGGAGGRFPETRVSAVAAASSGDAVAREVVIGVYWKPIYKYLRVQWKCSNEDAKDLTQDFLARALENDFFAGYDPGRARFRSYLRAALDHFIANVDRARRRLKRSGDVVSLDFVAAEGELAMEPVDTAASMDEFFQTEWAREVFSLAVEAMRRDYVARGREVRFAAFARYDLDPDASSLTYGELAGEMAIPVSQLTNWLGAARRDFRRRVLDQIRRMTASDVEFRAEVRALLGGEVEEFDA